MWTAANDTLLIVAASGLRTRPYTHAARSTAMTTSAGITAPGWRASAPFFGVTTNEPLLRSTV